MRVLVCGGRDYHNPKRVREVLSYLHSTYGFTTVITGGARGADQAADSWAHSAGIDRIIFPANWNKWGKAAGPYRNSLMIRIGNPTLVVAFPGGNGTADMVQKAKAEEIAVEIIKD